MRKIKTKMYSSVEELLREHSIRPLTPKEIDLSMASEGEKNRSSTFKEIKKLIKFGIIEKITIEFGSTKIKFYRLTNGKATLIHDRITIYRERYKLVEKIGTVIIKEMEAERDETRTL